MPERSLAHGKPAASWPGENEITGSAVAVQFPANKLARGKWGGSTFAWNEDYHRAAAEQSRAGAVRLRRFARPQGAAFVRAIGHVAPRNQDTRPLRLHGRRGSPARCLGSRNGLSSKAVHATGAGPESARTARSIVEVAHLSRVWQILAAPVAIMQI